MVSQHTIISTLQVIPIVTSKQHAPKKVVYCLEGGQQAYCTISKFQQNKDDLQSTGTLSTFFQARESISPSRLPSRHLLRVKGDVVFFLILGSPGFNKLFKEEARNFNPKCCLYKTTNVAAPVRELGVSIARSPTYVRLHQTHLQEPDFFLAHE